MSILLLSGLVVRKVVVHIFDANSVVQNLFFSLLLLLVVALL